MIESSLQILANGIHDTILIVKHVKFKSFNEKKIIINFLVTSKTKISFFCFVLPEREREREEVNIINIVDGSIRFAS